MLKRYGAVINMDPIEIVGQVEKPGSKWPWFLGLGILAIVLLRGKTWRKGT